MTSNVSQTLHNTPPDILPKKNFTHQALRLVSSGLVQRGAALFALVVPLAVRLPNKAEGALHSVEASNKHFRLLPKNSSLKKKRYSAKSYK